MDARKKSIIIFKLLNVTQYRGWVEAFYPTEIEDLEKVKGIGPKTIEKINLAIADKSKAEFVLVDSKASMPSSVRCEYRRIGLLKVASGYSPADVKCISERPKAVEKIVRTWERLYLGKTERCAYRVALSEAKARLAELNNV